MALTLGLLYALKDAPKIHAASEGSDHSLDYYCTFSTTIDNPVIRALVQKQVDLWKNVVDSKIGSPDEI